MALQIPVSSPLTEAQAELTSKIGSMKSLLSIDIDTNLNIPKEDQISTYDYLIKVLRALGVEPEIVFNLFLDKIFDQAGTFLEEKVLDAVADSLGEKGIQLPNTNNPNATENQKSDYKESNKLYLRGVVPATFLQAVKQQIAKNLVIMIFGPKNGPSESLNSDPSERDRLVEEAVCGVNLFSISSDPIVKEENVEYNRIALRQQLEKGEVVFEVSCQDVKITLPEEPGFFFEGGGQFSQSSQLPTPSQSLQLAVEYVKNQAQNINNEQNSNSVGKSFNEILITKMLNYMSSLLFPFLGPIFSVVQSTPAGNGIDASSVAYSNCDIADTAGDSSQNPVEKQSFFKSLANALLKELLRLLLVLAVKEFKRLVANYFARTAIEKQRRRVEKLRQKFEIFKGVSDTASKAAKYAAAAAALVSILGQIPN